MKMQNNEQISLTETQNQIRLLNSDDLILYKEKVEVIIKELETTISVLQADQKQLNLINKIIKEELGFRNYLT